MANFHGQSEHKLDGKGRLFLPRRIVDAVDAPAERSRFVVTIGADPCLYLFTPSGFEHHLEQVREAVRGTEAYPAVMRGVASLTHEGTLDGQYRLLVPEKLRRHAGLEKEVIVVGVFDHVEIWDARKWAGSAEEQAEQAYLRNAAAFFRGGRPRIREES